jgi:hypothetical protein
MKAKEQRVYPTIEQIQKMLNDWKDGSFEIFYFGPWDYSVPVEEHPCSDILVGRHKDAHSDHIGICYNEHAGLTICFASSMVYSNPRRVNFRKMTIGYQDLLSPHVMDLIKEVIERIANETYKTRKDMEVKIQCPYLMTFGDVYQWLQEEKRKYDEDTLLVTEFNGKYLDSGMSENELYIAYYGMGIQEFKEERKRRDEEHKKLCAQLEEERKEREAKYQKWIKDNYGTEEAYHEALTQKYCDKVQGLFDEEMEHWFITKDISESLYKEWREMVSKNLNALDKVEEIIYIVKRIKDAGDDYKKVFPELREYMFKQDHSGSTATWVIKNVAHFALLPGVQFETYQFDSDYRSEVDKELSQQKEGAE